MVRSRTGGTGWPDRTPTAVLVGSYDFICGQRWADQLHRAIPHSRLAVLDRRGHMGHLEQPDAFARAVLDLVNCTR